MADCPACDAKGFETWSDEIPCAACDGTGNLMGGPCPECKGGGRIQADTHIVCEFCHGAGQVLVDPPKDADI
jgi:DnaJ-class molecular chaperone